MHLFRVILPNLLSCRNFCRNGGMNIPPMLHLAASLLGWRGDRPLCRPRHLAFRRTSGAPTCPPWGFLRPWALFLRSLFWLQNCNLCLAVASADDGSYMQAMHDAEITDSDEDRTMAAGPRKGVCLRLLKSRAMQCL